MLCIIPIKIWFHYKACSRDKTIDGLICSLAEVVIQESEVNIIEKIKIARGKNKEVVKVVEKIKKAKIKELREDEWQIEKDLVLKEEKIHILKDEILRIEIIQLHHNVLVARHRGR